MHKIALPPHVLDNIEKRRGGRHHIFDRLDPAKTALVVIDMQKYFMEPGMAGEVPTARDIVPNINRLASALRAAGGRVAWVTNNFPDDICESWSVMMRDIFSVERREAMLEHLREGGAGHPLWPELVTAPEDWQLYKNRFSAFIQGSSDLEARLRAEGRDTVIVTGTLTNVCCESTARDAMMRNFKTVMVSDANAALTDEDHNYSLGALVQVFADVMTTDEVIARLNSGEAAAAE
ncbi:MAG: cysteine hydrolase [Alphaproteobacteria bacterium]|nr:cysteine hydrolase [Alphaproteobacteria bacterium]